MNIQIMYQVSEEELSVVKDGDKLIINGETFDFSVLQDGDELPWDAIDSEFIQDGAEKINGEVWLSLRVPVKDGEYVKVSEYLVDAPDGVIV